MSDKKLNFVLNHYIYKNNRAYAAVGLGGGCVTRDFIIDGTERFHGNYAFFNILADYWKIQQENKEVKFNAGRTTTFLSIDAEPSELFGKITAILETLLKHKYKQEVFEKAKEKAKKSYSDYYKDSRFRARYKSFEFLDLNKHFLLSELNRDIEEIEFADFLECVEKLIVPANMCIYATGDMTETEKSDYERFSEIIRTKNHTVQLYNFSYDPYMKNDAHIIELAREDINQFVAAFDFLNPDCSEFTKNMIVDIYAEILKIPGVEISVDSCDAGILYSGKTVKSVKDQLVDLSGDEYDKARKTVVKRYLMFLQNNPEIFILDAVKKLLQGIYIQEYISYIQQCSYEKFVKLCSIADYKISEAQVIFRKELI